MKAAKKIILISVTSLLVFFEIQAQPVITKAVLSPTQVVVQLSKAQLARFCGEYLPTGSDPRMTVMTVVVYKDVLYRCVNGGYIALNALSDHKFSYDDNSGRSLDFISDKSGKITEVLVERNDGVFTLRKNPGATVQAPVASAKPVIQKITELVDKYVEYRQFNGSILVSNGGKVIYKKAFGMADFELNTPNRIDTKYRLASVSKQFTAMLILQLVHEKKLDLHVPITTYLPEYPKTQGQKITVHHLLTHSAGIPNFTNFRDYELKVMRNPHTPEQLVHLFDTLALEFEPGKQFNYSNSGYVLLGYIIEKVSGKSYEQCLKDQIFTPLKMKNSGFDHNRTVLPGRAQGYEFEGKSLVNAGFIDMSVPYSAGSLYSTVDDLFLWDQALYSNVLLPENLLEKAFVNYFDGKGGNYGYGWGINRVVSVKQGKTLHFAEHSGGINGFNTFISRIITDKHCVIALSNTSGVPLSELAHGIEAIIYDLPYDLPKKSLAFELEELIRTQGLSTGLAKYKSMKGSGVYKMNESDMNVVGYNFLEAKKFPEAIEVFKINVEAFPYSGNCYDSLGEAYMKNGDKPQAIENYRKSIALDPQNENGKKILEKLLE